MPSATGCAVCVDSFYRASGKEEKATKNISGKRMGEKGTVNGRKGQENGRNGQRSQEKKQHMEFAGGPVVRTQCLYCWDPILMPESGTRSHMPWPWSKYLNILQKEFRQQMYSQFLHYFVCKFSSKKKNRTCSKS